MSWQDILLVRWVVPSPRLSLSMRWTMSWWDISLVRWSPHILISFRWTVSWWDILCCVMSISTPRCIMLFVYWWWDVLLYISFTTMLAFPHMRNPRPWFQDALPTISLAVSSEDHTAQVFTIRIFRLRREHYLSSRKRARSGVLCIPTISRCRWPVFTMV